MYICSATTLLIYSFTATLCSYALQPRFAAVLCSYALQLRFAAALRSCALQLRLAATLRSCALLLSCAERMCNSKKRNFLQRLKSNFGWNSETYGNSWKFDVCVVFKHECLKFTNFDENSPEFQHVLRKIPTPVRFSNFLKFRDRHFLPCAFVLQWWPRLHWSGTSLAILVRKRRCGR